MSWEDFERTLCWVAGTGASLTFTYDPKLRAARREFWRTYYKRWPREAGDLS